MSDCGAERLSWLREGAAAQPALIGVVHLPATPGSPGHDGDLDALVERAVFDARALRDGGARALIVENFGDAPFHAERVPPEAIASMAIAIAAIRRELGELPLGVNVLRNDARAALGLAAACHASFVRVNVHVGAAVTDQGLIQGRAAETLRERDRLCPRVAILADVHVKHAVSLGPSDIAQAARETAGRGLADGLIVSGVGTGHAVDAQELAQVRAAVPDQVLLLGSGVDPSQAQLVRRCADGAIVGTWLKRDGRVDRAVDVERVRALAQALRGD